MIYKVFKYNKYGYVDNLCMGHIEICNSIISTDRIYRQLKQEKIFFGSRISIDVLSTPPKGCYVVRFVRPKKINLFRLVPLHIVEPKPNPNYNVNNDGFVVLKDLPF